MCYGFSGPFAWGGMGFGMGLGMILHAAIFGLLLFFGYKLFKRCQASPVLCEANRSLEVLKTRYAKGEVTTEEYHQIRKELE